MPEHPSETSTPSDAASWEDEGEDDEVSESEEADEEMEDGPAADEDVEDVEV